MGERTSGLKARMTGGERLVGTFVKTPDVQVIEALAIAGLDFVVLDAEHSPWGRDRLDPCLAVARALDLPALVRVPDQLPGTALSMLDMGAVGLVVPHVDTVEKARAIGKAAHFGKGGRGFAGSTRWAGYATRGMADVLDQDAETLVLAQIEEPEGVEACEEIAAAEGIDGLFIGPSDLSVSYGHRSADNDDLSPAYDRVGKACRDAGIAFATWVPNEAGAARWTPYGAHVFVAASEITWMVNGAKAAMAAIREA